VRLVVSARGGKYGYVTTPRQDVYKALRRRGYSKKVSAMIANRGDTHGERSAMARKAAATRRRRGRRG